ncbi:uncharacterized protein LOC125489223 [Plutella xylostella]|uniref:uncharacterized protein LOC125489223 n=1 Tax=Plutella xylostella TaxID=51655 RepID=UPI002032D632|nr:uncharacterized protein LOC125489223 [Plutella xylostella]
MGVTCKVLLNRPRVGFHTPGGPVIGVVRYTVDKPTKFTEIVLSVKGEGKCNWTTSVNNRTTHYSGREKYVDMKKKLQVTNTSETELEVATGEYEENFCFYLPNCIPSSYKDGVGSISYRVQIKLVRPGVFQFNKKFYRNIIVREYRNAISPQIPLHVHSKKTLFLMFSAKEEGIVTNCTINKSVLLAGFPAELNIFVSNNSTVKIKKMNAELVSHNAYTSGNGCKKKIFKTHKSCSQSSGSIKKSDKAEMSLTLPTKPDMVTVRHSSVISREYEVHITAILPFPHRNQCLKIPVVIETRRGLDMVDEATLENTKSSSHVDSYSAVNYPETPPPSYWKVMCEDKEINQK